MGPEQVTRAKTLQDIWYWLYDATELHQNK
jgi:hypothetical protein